MILKKSAEKQFAALPQKARAGVAARIDTLAFDPLANGAEKLDATNGLWRVRWGNYRIIYQRPDGDGVVRVLKIGHRKDVYRGV